MFDKISLPIDFILADKFVFRNLFENFNFIHFLKCTHESQYKKTQNKVDFDFQKKSPIFDFHSNTFKVFNL